MTTANRLGQAIASERGVLTAEWLPPRDNGPQAAKSLAELLPASLDALVVADNPGRIGGSALACSALLSREGRDTVVTMTTRDRNRIALESDALGASALGVAGILCVSGNHPSLGVSPQAGASHDIDSVQLVQATKNLELPGMLVGAVAHPYQQPLELNLLRLRKKISAGADFVLTQPVFDLAGFTAWMDALRATGLDRLVAIIASVLPLPGVDEAELLHQRQTHGPLDEDLIARLRKAPDASREGVAIASEAAASLKRVPGIRGIHILCGGHEALAGKVIEAAGLG
jgi:5,10-methylenetetrahydrofolate reductase